MRFARLALILALLSASIDTNAATRTATTSEKAGTAPLTDLRVFRAFHERTGIERVVAASIVRYQADKRIADIFRATDLAHLQTQLSNQICYILGGPCIYSGKTMAEAHKDVGLQDADFNALVEDLQSAMSEEHVPFWAQNKLLAKLAPMHREVVVR